MTCGNAYAPAKNAVSRLYRTYRIHSGNPTSHAVKFAKHRYLNPMLLWSAVVEVVTKLWNTELARARKGLEQLHAAFDAVIHLRHGAIHGCHLGGGE